MLFGGTFVFVTLYVRSAIKGRWQTTSEESGELI